MTKHYWKYDGHDNHKNEDWYKCTKCGHKDWWPIYTDPDKEKIKCPKCGMIPNETPSATRLSS